MTRPVTGQAYNPRVLTTLLALGLGVVVGAAVTAAILMARQTRLASEAAGLRAELTAAMRATEEQRALLAQAQSQLRETFASLSKDALKENRQEFLHNADALLSPVRDTLNRVQAQLADVDKAREGSYRAVTWARTSAGRVACGTVAS